MIHSILGKTIYHYTQLLYDSAYVLAIALFLDLVYITKAAIRSTWGSTAGLYVRIIHEFLDTIL